MMLPYYLPTAASPFTWVLCLLALAVILSRPSLWRGLRARVALIVAIVVLFVLAFVAKAQADPLTTFTPQPESVYYYCEGGTGIWCEWFWLCWCW